MLEARGWKGRLACVPWCKFVLASGRSHASNPLVSGLGRQPQKELVARGRSISSTFLRDRDRNVCVHVADVVQVVQNSPTSPKLIAMVELIPRLKMASHVAGSRYFEEVRYRAFEIFLVRMIINLHTCLFIHFSIIAPGTMQRVIDNHFHNFIFL